MTLVQFQILITAFACLAAMIAAGCALWNTIRAGRWRDTDDAIAIGHRFKNVEDRVLVVEQAHKTMPTQSTIASLSNQMVTAAHDAKSAADGVKRIEKMIMEQGFKAR